jgi:hypothetical protein
MPLMRDNQDGVGHMSNLLCPICGALFYGIDVGRACPHVKKKVDGTYEFIGPTQMNTTSDGVALTSAPNPDEFFVKRMADAIKDGRLSLTRNKK